MATRRSCQIQPRRLALMLLNLYVLASSMVEATTFDVVLGSLTRTSSIDLPTTLYMARGGAADGGGVKKKKKKRKGTKHRTPKDPEKAKEINTDEDKEEDVKDKISEALETSDAADALGDAIRQNPSWLNNNNEKCSPLVESIDMSIRSVGWSIGATDYENNSSNNSLSGDDSDRSSGDGGIEAAPTSIVMYYFLKSHGGAHALQCVCSLLSTGAGLASILFPLLFNGNAAAAGSMQISLMKRSLLLAMLKHVSGLLAASALAAKAIPELGLSKTRKWMQQLAADPVSQYMFYTSCVWLWLPFLKATSAPAAVAAASDATVPVAVASAVVCWWQSYKIAPLVILGPILIREMVSTVMVFHDVLVLIASSSNQSSKLVTLILGITGTAINAVMSVLVTPKVWRSASRAQQQELLAKLSAKFSLILELAVGALMVADAGWAVTQFGILSSQSSTSFTALVRRIVCTKLYLDFLWNRRRKAKRLATEVRGGAAHLPMYLLNVLNDPMGSMGLQMQTVKTSTSGTARRRQERAESPASWKDYLKAMVDTSCC